MGEELEPIGAEAPAEARHSRRRPLTTVLWAVTALAVAVGAVALLVGGRERTPEAELAQIRDFVAQARSVHFVARTESVTSYGDDEEVGSEETTRSRMVGDLVLPDQGRWVDESEGSTTEVIGTADGVYLRMDSEHEDPGPQPWAFYARQPEDPLQGGAVPGGWDGYAPGAAAFAAYAGNGGLPWVGPGGLEEILERLKSPERMAPNVIRARMALGDLLAAENLPQIEGFEMPDGTVTIDLTSGAGGRLERMVWKVESTQEMTEAFLDVDEEEDLLETGYASVDTTDVAFSRWDQPVTITPPPVAAVDPTPSVDEEALAQFDAFAIPVPRSLPDGFELVSAWTFDLGAEIGDEEIPELPSCPQVDLMWSAPYDPSAKTVPPQLNLSAVKADCDGLSGLGDYFGGTPPPPPGVATNEADARPFVAGKHRGTIAEMDDEFPGEDQRTVDMTVDGVNLTIFSSLPEAELARILADMVPFGLDAQRVQRQVPPGR